MQNFENHMLHGSPFPARQNPDMIKCEGCSDYQYQSELRDGLCFNCADAKTAEAERIDSENAESLLKQLDEAVSEGHLARAAVNEILTAIETSGINWPCLSPEIIDRKFYSTKAALRFLHGRE